jgi:hypothetical protein
MVAPYWSTLLIEKKEFTNEQAKELIPLMKKTLPQLLEKADESFKKTFFISLSRIANLELNDELKALMIQDDFLNCSTFEELKIELAGLVNKNLPLSESKKILNAQLIYSIGKEKIQNLLNLNQQSTEECNQVQSIYLNLILDLDPYKNIPKVIEAYSNVIFSFAANIRSKVLNIDINGNRIAEGEHYNKAAEALSKINDKRARDSLYEMLTLDEIQPDILPSPGPMSAGALKSEFYGINNPRYKALYFINLSKARLASGDFDLSEG